MIGRDLGSGMASVMPPRVGRKAALAAARQKGGSNSVVESQPSKLLVAGSIPVSRSIDLVQVQ